MKIFKVEKIKLYESGHLKAFVNVSIADAFVVTGFKVMEGPKGLFVAMPQREVEVEGKGIEYREICFPAKGYGKEFQEAVLKAYKAYKKTADERKRQLNQ